MACTRCLGGTLHHSRHAWVCQECADELGDLLQTESLQWVQVLPPAPPPCIHCGAVHGHPPTCPVAIEEAAYWRARSEEGLREHFRLYGRRGAL